MPSSGLPVEIFWKDGMEDSEILAMNMHIQNSASHAMRLGLFIEWLESFVGAWNTTRDGIAAANAGITEWDM